jgi:hypothetical protein
MLKAIKNKKRDQIHGEVKTLLALAALTDETKKDLAMGCRGVLLRKFEEERYIEKVFETVTRFVQSEMNKHIHFITIELDSTGNFKYVFV